MKDHANDTVQQPLTDTTINSDLQRRNALMKDEELKRGSFWVSQILMAVFTILGVYLAAESGLQQALKFDTYSKMEDNYYLRLSLYDEVNDNVIQLRTYATDVLARSRPIKEIKNNRPVLDRYIWTTMQYSPTTLETPSQILSGVRRFYAAADRIMNQAENRFVGAALAGKKLQAEIDQVEKNILPLLRSSALKLKTDLAGEGIEVGYLKVAE